jgi:threonine/homoserine/homoserine lactone efflux protein
VTEALWLGVLFGVGAALAVGPITATIVQEALARGLGASFRVILGSATADLVLIVPALAAGWLLAGVAGARLYVALVGAAYFVYLAAEALRDSRRMWRGGAAPAAAPGWAFGKGMLGNLLNPLSWTFWLATGTPTMLRAFDASGWPGLLLFTATWFVVAMAIEAIIALAVVRGRRAAAPRTLAASSAAAAAVFVVLAGTLVIQAA